MFNSKSKSSIEDIGGTSTTIIGVGTSIHGNVSSNGDIRVDGHIIGNLEGKAKIIIGASGTVEGDIIGKHADVFGKVLGTIKVQDLLNINGKALVDGDLFAAKLHIEPTASFNGKCKMGSHIEEPLQKVLMNETKQLVESALD